MCTGRQVYCETFLPWPEKSSSGLTRVFTTKSTTSGGDFRGFNMPWQPTHRHGRKLPVLVSFTSCMRPRYLGSVLYDCCLWFCGWCGEEPADPERPEQPRARPESSDWSEHSPPHRRNATRSTFAFGTQIKIYFPGIRHRERHNAKPESHNGSFCAFADCLVKNSECPVAARGGQCE